MKLNSKIIKKFPLVSIIMNCYNGEKYLKNSIKSIIRQHYKNWEIIFFDNCSTDQSVSIIKSFENKKIKIYKSKKYLTLYAARNLALKYARGSYIAFLDTDDFWHPSKLNLQIKYILEKKKKFVFSNFYYLKDKKKSINKKMRSFKEGFVTQSLLDDYGLGILTVLMSKKFFNKKKFNPKYEIIGDFDYFLNLSINNYFGYIDKPLAYYRVHKNNFSQKKINLWIEELKNWLKKNKMIFNKKGFKLLNQQKYLYKLKIKKILENYL
jgi:glycosyltransferase involved in cell wall biosynthesis